MNRACDTLIVIVGLAVATRPYAFAQDSSLGRPRGTVIVGLDHIPLVVADLDASSRTYERLGFTLKPGRPHPDGIRNSHVKFPDGSGIELITAPAAVDVLTSRYRQMLAAGEGPAFFALHARDTARLVTRLRGAFEFSQDDATVDLRAPELSYIFFVRDNRSPTDRPEHFIHANGARAMTRVWVATDDRDSLTRLLAALGGLVSARTVAAPDLTPATVVRVENGDVVVLPASHQVLPRRPVIGATFDVEDVNALAWRLTSAGVRFDADLPGRRLIVRPAETHGIWIEFRERR